MQNIDIIKFPVKMAVLSSKSVKYFYHHTDLYTNVNFFTCLLKEKPDMLSTFYIVDEAVLSRFCIAGVTVSKIHAGMHGNICVLTISYGDELFSATSLDSLLEKWTDFVTNTLCSNETGVKIERGE